VPKHLRNADRDSEWGYSRYRGWVQGYAIHLLCSATPGFVPVPLDADAVTANVPENGVFASIIEYLHDKTNADSGYDDGKLTQKREPRKNNNIHYAWRNTSTQRHVDYPISVSSNRRGGNACSD
jgi:hypothetical protein